MTQKNVLIIGIVGLPGAGKTTIAQYLVGRGYFHVTLSGFVRDEIIKLGIDDFSRKTYQQIANQMREEHGGDILAARAVEKIRYEQTSRAVIDGIRNVKEIAYLRKQPGFYLLGVVADSTLRFTRLSERTDTDKQIHRSLREFLKEEKREDSLGSDSTGLRVSDSLKEADTVLENNKGQEALFRKLDSLLAILEKKYERTTTDRG